MRKISDNRQSYVVDNKSIIANYCLFRGNASIYPLQSVFETQLLFIKGMQILFVRSLTEPDWLGTVLEQTCNLIHLSVDVYSVEAFVAHEIVGCWEYIYGISNR